MNTKIRTITLLFILGIFLLPTTSNAETGIKQLQTNLGTVGTQTGLGEQGDSDLKSKIADIVNIALGFLGIIAVIFIIHAGFKWITAGGNEEQVSKAKTTIRNAVIGLIIVFLSFSIINFTIAQLRNSGGTPQRDNGDTIKNEDIYSCTYYKQSDLSGGRVCIEQLGAGCPSTYESGQSGTLQLEPGNGETSGRCANNCPGCPARTAQ